MGLDVVGGASCLIRSREWKIPFPKDFTHYPERMPPETKEKLRQLVADALGNDLNRHSKDTEGIRRRLVVVMDGYLVLGVCAFLHEFLSPNEDVNGYRDENDRECFGFFGFVWDKNETPFLDRFPSLRSFQKLAEDKISKHWFAPRLPDETAGNYAPSEAEWQTQILQKGGFAVPFNLEVTLSDRDEQQKRDSESDFFSLNKKKPGQITVFSRQNEDKLRACVLKEAAKAEIFSFCTNLNIAKVTHKGYVFMNGTVAQGLTKEEEGKSFPNNPEVYPKIAKVVKRPPKSNHKAQQQASSSSPQPICYTLKLRIGWEKNNISGENIKHFWNKVNAQVLEFQKSDATNWELFRDINYLYDEELHLPDYLYSLLRCRSFTYHVVREAGFKDEYIQKICDVFEQAATETEAYFKKLNFPIHIDLSFYPYQG